MFVQWLCILELSQSVVPVMWPSTAGTARNRTSLNLDCRLDEGKFQSFSYSQMPGMNLPYEGEHYRDEAENFSSSRAIFAQRVHRVLR